MWSPLTSPSSATVESEPAPAVAPKGGSESVGSAPVPMLLENTPKPTIAIVSASMVRGCRRSRLLMRPVPVSRARARSRAALPEYAPM